MLIRSYWDGIPKNENKTLEELEEELRALEEKEKDITEWEDIY